MWQHLRGKTTLHSKRHITLLVISHKQANNFAPEDQNVWPRRASTFEHPLKFFRLKLATEALRASSSEAAAGWPWPRNPDLSPLLRPDVDWTLSKAWHRASALWGADEVMCPVPSAVNESILKVHRGLEVWRRAWGERGSLDPSKRGRCACEFLSVLKAKYRLLAEWIYNRREVLFSFCCCSAAVILNEN